MFKWLNKNLNSSTSFSPFLSQHTHTHTHKFVHRNRDFITSATLLLKMLFPVIYLWVKKCLAGLADGCSAISIPY